MADPWGVAKYTPAQSAGPDPWGVAKYAPVNGAAAQQEPPLAKDPNDPRSFLAGPPGPAARQNVADTPTEGVGKYLATSVSQLHKGVGDVWEGAKETVLGAPQRFHDIYDPVSQKVPVAGPIAGAIGGVVNAAVNNPLGTMLGEAGAASGYTPLMPRHPPIPLPKYVPPPEPPRSMPPLVPARRFPEGAVDAGAAGEKHKDVLAREGTTKAQTPPEQLGFVKPSGEFLSREQAAKEVGAPVDKLHTSDLKKPAARRANPRVAPDPDISADEYEKMSAFAKDIGNDAKAEEFRRKAETLRASLQGQTPKPESIGAAAAPSTPRPTKVERAATNALEDDIFRTMRSRPQERDVGVRQRYDALPAEMRDRATEEKLYRYGEGDPAVKLTPEERALFEQHIAPRVERNRQIWEEIRTQGKAAGATQEELDAIKELDPMFMHRMVKGRTGMLDEGFFEATPQTQGQGRSLGSAPGLQGAVYHSLEGPGGDRRVIVEKNGKLFDIDPLKGLVEIETKTYPKAIKPGAEVDIGGDLYRLKRARTAEIEQAVPGLQYHKNAFLSAELNGVQLERAAEELAMLRRIKADPAFEPFMSKRLSATPSNWKTTKLPAFSGYRMDPHLAHIFDDLAGREPHQYLDTLAAINRAMIGTLFWNPLPHLANVATHAYVARGWQNFNPLSWPSSLRTAGRAMKEVATQGPLYRQMLKEGSSLIYSRVQNRNMWQDMMKGFGEEAVKDPERSGLAELARRIGAPPKALYDAVMSASNKALWAGGDVFMMHRVMELQEKGVPLRQAIHEAERDIPNYRIPAEVWQGPGGRIASEAMRNQIFNLFGRYHYGVARGIATIGKDLAVGDMKTKVDAAGKAVSLGVLAGAAYEFAADPLVRAILGDENVQQLSAQSGEPPKASRRGPASPVQTAVEALTGKGVDWNAVARTAGFMESPVDQFIVALLANVDWKGSKIVEPASPVVQQLGQAAQYGAGVALAPAAQVERYLKSPDALRAFFADTILGYRKTPPQGGWAATIGRRAAQKRERKPNGVIESWVNSLGRE